MDTIFDASEQLPPKETEVLVFCKGAWRIGALFTDHPTYEDNYTSYDYWDDPHHEGQGWEMDDVTHWTNLPALPVVQAKKESDATSPDENQNMPLPTWLGIL